ncbi:MAG TPA: hypothetical protein VJ813_09530 [Vicinamibacterales bacterium]|nr:hypothetical protein [Vicinamibacterales bacterium]
MALRLPVALLRYLWALPNTLIGLLFLPFAMQAEGRLRIVDGVVEVHAPVIGAILRHWIPLHGGAAAMTFGHIVIGRDRKSLDAARCHERVHVRQCETWGPAFIPAYLIAGVWAMITGKAAYDGNYFECQARREAD